MKLETNLHKGIMTEVPMGRIVFSLMMRTMLFMVFGGIIAGIFAISGEDQPLKQAEKWWPFQAIFANLATFFILKAFLSKEGISFRSLFNFSKARFRKDLKETLVLLVVGLVLGALPLYFFSFLLLGSFIPPTTMFQALPMWAMVITLIVFPLSNGLVETTTYMGYALPRIQKATGKRWLAIIIAGLALAFQHVTLPLVGDIPYMSWRFLSFVPLALALGFIFTKTKRLLPIALAHFLMDLQLVCQLLLMNID
jgi:membrane protease YdiL (CAAX protease family)